MLAAAFLARRIGAVEAVKQPRQQIRRNPSPLFSTVTSARGLIDIFTRTRHPPA
jgi:hypothetical protein